MSRSWQVSIAALAAVGAFFVGRFCGTPSASASHVLRSDLPVVAGLAKVAVDEKADAAQEEAMSRALAVLLDTDGYNQSADLYVATRTLSLANLRELHARLMQMTDVEWLTEVVAERLVELDPAAALAHVRGLGDGKELVDPSKILLFWAILNPEAAIEEGLKNPLSGKGRELLKNAILGLAERDPASALPRLALIADPKTRSQTLRLCLTTWARKNPLEAAAWMKAHPETYEIGSEGNYAIAEFAGTLALRDPAIGRDFAQSLPDPLRTQALRLAIKDWSLLNPKAALQWGLENGVSLTTRDKIPDSKWAASSVISQMMLRAPATAVEWIEALPPETRAEMAEEALDTASAAFAEKLFALLPEENRPGSAPDVMWALNQRRVGGAKEWALKQPEGPVRVAALSNLMTRYTFDDPVGTIDKFPPGKSRDAAYLSHIEHTARPGKQPDLAIIPKIADAQLRQEAAETIYRVWVKTDGQAARQWLSSTPDLSAETKRRLSGNGQ